MGRYFALHDKEPPEVADAIRDHYKPLGPNDQVPSAAVSIAVALADKIDTLVSFFAIDERPTGSKDPFALRRAALGTIRTILESALRLSLAKVAHQRGSPPADLLPFFADRLKVALRDKGIRHDLIDAVFALEGQDDLVLIVHRTGALQAFLKTDDGTNLLAGYKRAVNIVKIEEKKDKRTHRGVIDTMLLSQAEEKSLHEAIVRVKADAAAALKREDFAAAMAALARLRAPVDAFFDKVTVNAEDPKLRENRLKLLNEIRDAMHTVADFSKIEG